MKKGVVEERSTQSGEEVVTWTLRATEEMVTPHACFVPLNSVHSSRVSDLWLIRVEHTCKYWSLSDLTAERVLFEPEKAYTFFKTSLAAVIAAEILIGPFAFQPDQLYFDALGKAFLSPLLTRTQKTTGIIEIFEQFQTIWSGKDTIEALFLAYLSPLIACIREESLQFAMQFLVNTVQKDLSDALTAFNTQLQTSDIAPFVQSHASLIHFLLSSFPIAFTICMNPRCKGLGRQRVSTCSLHYFCSEDCKLACNRQDNGECGLCGGVKRCFCGNEVKSDWRISYIGGSLYAETAKYCSEVCFLAKNPPNSSENPDIPMWTCLNCEFIGEEREFRHMLDCEAHVFCSSRCYNEYLRDMVPFDFDIWPTCLLCSKRLCELAKLKGREAEMRPLIARLDQERATYMRIKNPAAFTRLFNFIHEVEEMLLQDIRNFKHLPLSLSLQDMESQVYFLGCLVCDGGAIVHKRKESEMLTWGDVPFLVKCEVQLHAVCSLACFDELMRTCEACPECEDFALDFDIASVDRSCMHPTLEALRRTAGSHCVCGMPGLEFISLPHCAHEVCRQCLLTYIVEKPEEYYFCKICRQAVSREYLLKQV